MPVGFRIDPSEARTDLYGIGKGAAQVLDLSPLREQAAQEQKQNFIKKQTEQKLGEERVSDINTQLSGLNKLAVMPREQPMFAKMQADVYEDVKKNIGKIRTGDSTALLAVQQKIGDIYTKAELSKNTREQVEANAKTMLAKGYDKYRGSSIDYLNDFITNPENNGNYNFDTSNIGERFDYGEHVRKDLVPSAQKFAAENKQGYQSRFTIDQANQAIANDIVGDHQKLMQAQEDFDSASDKLGATTPVEYMQKKYAGEFLVNKNEPVPQFIANPDVSKNINVTNTVTDTGGEMHMMNKTNNEDVTVHYNDKGEVTGGVQGTRLTPEEKAQNDAVFRSNIAKKKAYNDALQKARAFEATIDETTMTPEDYKAATKLLAARIPKKNDPAFMEDELPFKEKNISLDKKQAQEIAHDKFGVKPQEIIEGKTPKNVDVQHINAKTETAPASKTDWSKYKRK